MHAYLNLSRTYRDLLRKDLNKKNRERLCNKDFSIISSNCVGGVITHELGLKFLSPTINLYLFPKEYLKLIYNLQHYISCGEMTEDTSNSEKCGYPVGILEDIRLYFVHYSSFDEAKNKWYERCNRINWDNLYFIMVQRDGCTNEDLLKFDDFPSNHKVVFTSSNRNDIKSSFFIPGSVSEKGEVIDLNQYKNRFTGKRWLDDFDYVSFLNSRE